MVKVILNMNNGDKHKIVLRDINGDMAMQNALQYVIFSGYKKSNELNINCFELDNEEKTSIAINLDNVSSVEYGFKAVD